jgi:hypothetical protein
MDAIEIGQPQFEAGLDQEGGFLRDLFNQRHARRLGRTIASGIPGSPPPDPTSRIELFSLQIESI